MSRQVTDHQRMAVVRELDPAGARVDLSREERARADAAFLRIVAAPDHAPLPVEPERPGRLRRRLTVGAGLAGATGVAASALLLGGTAFGSWSATPTPLGGSAAITAGASCLVALDVPDRGERVQVAEQRGAWTYVLMSGAHTEAACLLPNDLVGADATDLEGKTFGSYDADAVRAPRVARSTIRETMSMSGSTDEGLLNWSAGYVGRDIVGVTVHTPTGLTVKASVSRGRFAAWWPAGEAKADNPEIAEASTFVVTLRDGSTRPAGG